jgi:hypothetical protein
MPNPHPDALRARLAKKKLRRKPGTLADVLEKLWDAICEAEQVLYQAEEPELRLKAIHALSQCAGQYCKLIEGVHW